MRRTGLAFKLNGVMLLLAAAAVSIAIIGLETIWTYQKKVADIQLASQRAILGKEANSLVLLVVMDSRGIYMARDHAEAEKYAKPILANLKLLGARMEQWRALLPETRRSELDGGIKGTQNFIAFRTELVRLSREATLPEARAFGDNEANRSNRKKLDEELEALANSNSREIAVITEALDSFFHQRMVGLVAVAIGGVFGVGLLSIVLVRRGVTGPLRLMTRAMKSLASGDLEVNIPATRTHDEMGDMARALEIFKANALDRARLEQEAAVHQERAEEAKRTALVTLAESFDAKIGGHLHTIVAASGQLEATARVMSGTAEETNGQSTAVAAAAEQASRNVQMVASATEELAHSAEQIGSHAEHSFKVVHKAVDDARQTDAIVCALSLSAQKIGAVVALITKIAEQTNLLALNATIEAARAGEFGRGFAVVAGEVKALAAQTAKATSDIAPLIAHIQEGTNAAVAAVSGVGSTISEVHAISSSIAEAVQKQHGATAEIAHNVAELSRGSQEVTTNIEQVRDTARQTGNAAEDVLAAAGNLARCSTELSNEIKGFLATVRAA